MSEFDEALAQAVREGTAPGRLPGAADAIRRGRRRGLRARGGLTMLGVAVVAGALGSAGVFGSGPTVGAAAGSLRPEVHGVLPVSQWPGYDTQHWRLSAGCGLSERWECARGDMAGIRAVDFGVSSVWGACAPDHVSYPARKYASYRAQSSRVPKTDEIQSIEESEQVYTLPDRASAAALLAELHALGSPKACPGYATIAAPGVSTADGLSWLMNESGSGDGYTAHSHGYLVQVDNRVAMLRVEQFNTDILQNTENDAQVLADMAKVLE